MPGREAQGEAQGPAVLAGIVTYHPDLDHLARLVGRVAPQVRKLVVYANSELNDEERRRLEAAAGARPLAILAPGGNAGLGIAYNALVDLARAEGDAFLFLLDQDSLPEADTIEALMRTFERLRKAGERPAVIGPCARGADGAPMKVAAVEPAHYATSRARRTAFVISSGSLIATAAATAVGPFRDDYFIDAIDLEWCMRADARGYSVWIADEAGMDHRLGQGVIGLPFGLRLALQPPLRLYTYLRNQCDMLRLAHVPGRHKAKFLLGLPLRIPVYLVQARFGRETARAIWKGLRDGAAGRLGPPQGRL